MKTNTDTAFELSNFFKQRFPFSKSPVGQIEFSKSVHSSIQDREHLIIRAPRGAGKRLGYLVPAVYQAVFHRKRVVVSCASEQLKRQLVGQTLPELQQALPWDFTFSALKTREKYLCVQKYVAESEGRNLDADGIKTSHAVLDMVRNWVEKTETGDFGELPILMPSRFQRRLASADHECRGKYCPLSGQCYFHKARMNTQNSEIVVCDHKTLFHHVDASSKPRTVPCLHSPLPKFDVAIIDECAWTEMAAREAFGFRINIDRFRDAAEVLSESGVGDLWPHLAKEYETYLNKLRGLRIKKRTNRFQLPLPIRAYRLLEFLHAAAWRYAEAAHDNLYDLGLDFATGNDYRRAERECRILQRQIEFVSSIKNRDWEVIITDDSHGIAEIFCQPRDLKRAIAPLFNMATCVMVIDNGFSISDDLKTYRDAYGVPSPRMISIDTKTTAEEINTPSCVPIQGDRPLCPGGEISKQRSQSPSGAEVIQ